MDSLAAAAAAATAGAAAPAAVAAAAAAAVAATATAAATAAAAATAVVVDVWGSSLKFGIAWMVISEQQTGFFAEDQPSSQVASDVHKSCTSK